MLCIKAFTHTFEQDWKGHKSLGAIIAKNLEDVIDHSRLDTSLHTKKYIGMDIDEVQNTVAHPNSVTELCGSVLGFRNEHHPVAK